MGVTQMKVERVLTVRQSNGKYVTPGQVSVLHNQIHMFARDDLFTSNELSPTPVAFTLYGGGSARRHILAVRGAESGTYDIAANRATAYTCSEEGVPVAKSILKSE